MDLIVQPNHAAQWQAQQGENLYACALGKGGFVTAANKTEGDGATPLGRWTVLRVLYREDRGSAPICAFDLQAISPSDGWCDAPSDPLYNQQVPHPYPANHEVLWREDQLYDILVVLNHNSDPVVPGLGSAIFLHCAKPDYPPTVGCVALARPDLEAVLDNFQPGDAVVISR